MKKNNRVNRIEALNILAKIIAEDFIQRLSERDDQVKADSKCINNHLLHENQTRQGL